jgi:multiple sugar transport system substrate-binding protein
MHIRAQKSISLPVVALLLLSACSPGPTYPAPTPSLSAATSTSGPAPTITPTPIPSIAVDPSALRGLSLQVWHAFAGGADIVFASQVDRFNSINEWGIKVTQTGYGDYPALFDAVDTAIESGGTPDLVAALPEQTLGWNTTAIIVDLSPYINDPAWGLGSDVVADFPPVFWAQDIVAGKQLGVPAERSARFLFYNKTWAQELGFVNPPVTADEFRQQACAANASFRADSDPQNDGYGGWIVDTDWQTTYSWMLAFGGGVVDGTAYGFRTDPNLAALQFLKGLYDDNCAWLATDPNNPDIISSGPYFDQFADRSALFVSGDLAGLPMASESMSRLKNQDEWTLLPFPGSSESVVVTYGPSFSLLKSMPEKQLASWLFVRWLLSPENQAGWVEATGLFPLFHSLLDHLGSTRTSSPQWDAAVEDLSLAQGVPQLASWRKVRYLLEDGVKLIFQTNLPLDQIPSILTEMDSTAKEIGSP